MLCVYHILHYYMEPESLGPICPDSHMPLIKPDNQMEPLALIAYLVPFMQTAHLFSLLKPDSPIGPFCPYC